MESGGLQGGLRGGFIQQEAAAKSGAQLDARMRFALGRSGIKNPFGGAHAWEEIEVSSVSSVPTEPGQRAQSAACDQNSSSDARQCSKAIAHKNRLNSPETG